MLELLRKLKRGNASLRQVGNPCYPGALSVKSVQCVGVRYEAVNAMLLNEFLKEHRKVEQLEKQVAALTVGLQQVSAQLELSKSSPRTVLNNQ
jgi:hypothetical protein